MEIYLSTAGMALVMLLGQSGAPARLQTDWTSLSDRFSHSLGNCRRCEAGESMAVSVVTVPNSRYVDINSPPCADPSMSQPVLSNDTKAMLAKSFYNQPAKTAVFALGLTVTQRTMPPNDLETQALAAVLRKGTRSHQTSSCGRNVIVVPKAATVTRVEKSMDCPAGGWCEHQSDPHFEDLDDNLRAYTVVGKNWSHNMSASTTLRVFYRR